MAQPSTSQRLHEQLSQMIAAAQPGGRLPSEPALAAMLKVSRATLREAMRTFETQGLIRRQQGSGTYVNHPPSVLDSGLEALESLDSIARRHGLSVTMGHLTVELRAPSAGERELFSLLPEEQVTHITRVMLTEKRPIAYLIDILPAHILGPDDLSAGFDGSILNLLLGRSGLQLSTSFTEIQAVNASSPVAYALGIQRGVGLLHFAANLYSLAGEVIDRSYSYFLPGFFRFHVVRRVENSPVRKT